MSTTLKLLAGGFCCLGLLFGVLGTIGFLGMRAKASAEDSTEDPS
jgi:hypothetical protein